MTSNSPAPESAPITPATSADRLPVEQLKGPAWLRSFLRWLGLPPVALTFGIVAATIFVVSLVLRFVAPDIIRVLVEEVRLDPRSLLLGPALLAMAGLQVYRTPRVPTSVLIASLLGMFAVLGSLIWIVVAWIGSLVG